MAGSVNRFLLFERDNDADSGDVIGTSSVRSATRRCAPARRPSWTAVAALQAVLSAHLPRRSRADLAADFLPPGDSPRRGGRRIGSPRRGRRRTGSPCRGGRRTGSPNQGRRRTGSPSRAAGALANDGQVTLVRGICVLSVRRGESADRRRRAPARGWSPSARSRRSIRRSGSRRRSAGPHAGTGPPAPPRPPSPARSSSGRATTTRAERTVPSCYITRLFSPWVIRPSTELRLSARCSRSVSLAGLSGRDGAAPGRLGRSSPPSSAG